MFQWVVVVVVVVIHVIVVVVVVGVIVVISRSINSTQVALTFPLSLWKNKQKKNKVL